MTDLHGLHISQLQRRTLGVFLIRGFPIINPITIGLRLQGYQQPLS